MVHLATTQPPKRQDSLMQKSYRNIQTPTNHYLKPTTTSSWSSLDFSSFMTSSPTEIGGPDEAHPQNRIGNTNKVLPSTPYLHKSSITVLPTRSSSLTNPVTQLSHNTAPSRPLPSLPPCNERKSTLITTNNNIPTCKDEDEDDASSYNTAYDPSSRMLCESLENIVKIDNDIETAMLHWKRTSTLTLSKTAAYVTPSHIEKKDDYDSFFTENKELWSPSSIFGDIEAILKKPSMQENCQQVADQLWKKDESIVPAKEAAQFLGKSKLFNHTVLQLYLEKFDFTLQHLEHAFRCLCGKLYFKAEAQEIDRILQGFAYRYWYCNKQSKLLYNADIVYAVVYSMLLLNTDLHIVQGSSHHRMSRSEFCDNTLATIMNNILVEEWQHNKSAWKHDMESYLKETYTSVKLQGILQPGTHSVEDDDESIPAKESSSVTTTTKSLLQRMGSLKQTSSSSQRRKPNTDYNSSTNTKLEMTEYLHTKQDHRPGLEGRVRYRTNSDHLRQTTKSSLSSSSSSSSASSSSSSSSGWHEGWLTLHHDRGNLRLEKQQITSSRLIRPTNQVSSWEFDLGHSTAAREAPVRHNHHNDSSLATFHLVLGNGHWYEFECDNQDSVTSWIHHLQFAAVMATHIPFMRSPISSNLYGWEPNLTEQYDQLDSCTISTWEPPQHSTAPPLTSRISSSSTSSSTSSTSTTSSSLLAPPPSLSSHPFIYYIEANIINQQKGIQQYLVTLREEHQQHSTFFSAVSKIPTIYHTQKALITTNWHEKNDYLIQEMDKYGLYGKVLEAPMFNGSNSNSNSHFIDLSSILAIDNPIHSFDLFDEINHSLKHVSLE